MIKNILSLGIFKLNGENKSGIFNTLMLNNSILLPIAAADFLNAYFKLRINVVVIIMVAILFSIGLLLFDQNKTNLISYFIIIGLILTVSFFIRISKLNILKVIQKVYEWCLTYDKQEINYQKWYAFAVMIGIIFCCCIIIYMIHKIKQAKYVLALLLISGLIIASIYKIDIPKLSVGVVLIYSFIIVVEICGKILYKSNNVVDNEIATVYLVPVCFIIVILAMIMPSHENPISWKGVKDVISNIQEKGSTLITDIRYYFNLSESEFSLNFADYSEDHKNDLGGSIKSGNKNSLIVNTQDKSISRGYLIGSISNIYTGHRWEKSKSELEENPINYDYNYDFYELLLALTREQEAGTDLSNLIQKRTFEIQYEDIRTKTLFYPLKAFKVYSDEYMKFNENGQGALVYNKAKGSGNKYQVQYYELNLADDNMKKIIRNAGNNTNIISEKALSEVGSKLFYNTSAFYVSLKDINNELAARSEMIQANYTALPEELPDRVRQLAYEITKDYDNDYDKLAAIEAYLNRFQYTTKIERTPKKEDFVDYFLFEQQKGYCTYFATAMAVLSRCIGIPTRYVEGFVVDYKDERAPYDYKVSSKDAHSWVDAYIKGIGWIPFEPTPPYQTGRYTSWPEQNLNIGYHDPGVKLNTDIMLPDYKNQEKQHQLALSKRAVDQKIQVYITFGTIFGILLFICIFYVYYQFLERKYYKRYKNSSGNNKLSMIINEILRYMMMEGYQLSPSDTILSYANQIGDHVKFDHVTILDIIQIFMKVRYGEKQVEEEELRIALKFCKDFQKYLFEKLGKKKMFFDRFVFLHFNQ